MIDRIRSLQGRIIALVLAAVACIWLIAATMIWFDASHELDELLDSHLAQAAALLVAQQAGELSDEHHDVDTPTLHRYAPKVAFQVFHEGDLVLKSANAPERPMVPWERHFRSGFDTVRINDTTWRVFAAYGAERDVQVYVGEQARSRTSIMLAVLRSAFWPMAAALPLLGLLVWWAVRRGVSPLRELGHILATRQPGALSPVTLAHPPSEITPIVDALNQLFVRIADLLESERRFTADAAHELRTPIAAIRAQAQVALGEADDTARQRALQYTLDGCDRAARLVEQLLTLSRMESDSGAVMTPVDVGVLARSMIAELAPKALAKAQALELEGGEGFRIEGNDVLLSILLRNLVDNAVRYSPHSARVKVRIARDGDDVVVSVEDSGPGMSAQDAARLGERFFRVLGSGESGSGLGWSIIRRVAAVIELEVTIARSAELGGLAVTLRGRATPVTATQDGD